MIHDYRIFITKKGNCKLQLRTHDGQWIFYKDATRWEVEYNSYIDVLKHAGKYDPENMPAVYYEDMLLPHEQEEYQGQLDTEPKLVRADTLHLGYYPIAGWLDE